ncbi:MAG: OsmC family protein [Alphaproteobacteria bacterium]|nr:OsmC family protein [Alphaproteobacteria bacterium]
MTVRQHVNIEKLEEFRSFLADNPDKGKLRLEAKAIYEGQAGRSLVHVGPFGLDDQEIDRPTRHYTFPFGAWREVEEATGLEGATDRMEPVEMALAATAACLINSITFNTARLGIDTSGLEITVRSTVDPRVLFAVKEPEEHKSCLGSIEYEVKVTGEVSDEDLETIHKLCRYSPVHGLMAETITISGRVTRA